MGLTDIIAVDGARRRRRLALAILCLLCAAGLAIPRLVRASGPTPITDCSDDTQIQADATAGGSYAFTGNCTITLTHELTVSGDFSLDAGGHTVGLYAPASRAFDVAGGNVTLTGITISGQLEVSGTNGIEGTVGTGPGSTGGPGGTGGDAPAEHGGAMLIASGANVTISGGSVSGTLDSFGGVGGDGGENSGLDAAGGNGGSGGSAGDALGGAIYVGSGATLSVSGSSISGRAESAGGGGGFGGDAGAGQTQGDGGSGGFSGAAEGGGIYNAGTLSLASTSVNFSQVNAFGGDGGRCCVETVGGNGGLGGAGGNGGTGGNALGAGLYNAGSLTPGTGTFNDDEALADGGSGGTGSTTGGNGAGTNGGAAQGGGLYTTTTPLAPVCETFSANTVSSRGGANGGSNGPSAGPDIFAAGGASTGTCQTTLSVADAFVQEPTSGSTSAAFTVTLSQALQSPVTVNYATADGTAGNGYGAATVAHGDYKQTSGTLTFASGVTSQTVNVPVYATGLTQDSRFSLVLSGATGATIEKSIGIATIQVCGNPGVYTQNCPLVTVSDPTVVEPASGQTPTKFTVQLSQTAAKTVTVTLQTKDGTATTAAGNYVATTTTVTFAPGQTSQTVTVPVNAVAKPHEPLKFALVATNTTGGALLVSPWNSADATIFSPYVEFQAQVGQEVLSQKFPGLVQAGSTFAIHVTVHNYRPERVEIHWATPSWTLSGNATDGELLPSDQALPQGPATGAMSEAVPGPEVVMQAPNPSNDPGTLNPGEEREFNIAVRTTQSDATGTIVPSPGAPNGGTRATVALEAPDVSTLSQSNEETPLDPQFVTLDDGWKSYDVGIDDSAPGTPPFSIAGATWQFAKSLPYLFWDLAYGTGQGIWQLASDTVPSAISGLAQSASSFNMMKYIEYQVALWTAIKDDPSQFLATLETQVFQALAETPWELQQGYSTLKSKIDEAATAYYTQLSNDWYAGDWRAAEQDLVRSTGGAVVQSFLVADAIGPVAARLAPAVLTRDVAAVDAFEASAAKLYKSVGEALDPITRGIVKYKAGIGALDKIAAGYEFTNRQLEQLAGLSAKQVEWLRNFAQQNKLIITLRSRASASLKWLADGALLKPEWIKIKTVNWYDRYLGYSLGDIGRIVIRKPPSSSEFYDTLARYGVAKGTDEYENAVANYLNRVQEYHTRDEGYVRQLEEWEHAGKVRGRWNWADNDISPYIQSNEYRTYGFRIYKGSTGDVPQVRVNGVWRSITGDIDFTSITDQYGRALDDANYIHAFKEIRSGPVGAQHPAAATWTKGKQFMFALKEKYLSNGGKPQIQFGPDGVARAAVYDKNLNDLLQAFNFVKNKNNYYLWWSGGYIEPGP